MKNNIIGLIETGLIDYQIEPPFLPPKIFPEFPYSDNTIDKNNLIYSSIRDLFVKLNLDIEKLNTPLWNPLGEFIKPGNNVVIKPNFVREAQTEETNIHSIVTHGSIIRPIIDYCQIALKGQGKIVIADSPQFDSDFEKIIQLTGTKKLINYINEVAPIKISLLDLREEHVEYNGNVIVNRIKLLGDPEGYTNIDLGKESEFYKINELCKRIYGADYDVKETRRHHNKKFHEYRISNTILHSDVLINVPKLKTHKKAGISISLKNIIGINGNKNYLPHFRFGSVSQGGDEFEGESNIKKIISKFYSYLFKFMSSFGSGNIYIMRLPGVFYSNTKKVKIAKHEAGNWHGNDTIWRTIIDLNKILFYSDKQGMIQKETQRKYFSIVDGIIAGEREGPLNPSSKVCGIIIGGIDPVVVDMTSSRIMGFDYRMIPQIENSLKLKKYIIGGTLPQDILILSNNEKWVTLWLKNDNLRFEPHSGWKQLLK